MNPWEEFDKQMYEQAKNSFAALMGTGRMDLVFKLLAEQFPQMQQNAESIKALSGS